MAPFWKQLRAQTSEVIILFASGTFGRSVGFRRKDFTREQENRRFRLVWFHCLGEDFNVFFIIKAALLRLQLSSIAVSPSCLIFTQLAYITYPGLNNVFYLYLGYFDALNSQLFHACIFPIHFAFCSNSHNRNSDRSSLFQEAFVRNP